MITLPDYWMPRPDAVLDDTTRAAFDQLAAHVIEDGKNQLLDYRFEAPKWQFLCYLAEAYPIVLHGSGKPDIDCFEPRQPVDLTEFGNQQAVYAAADGIWSMFFAVMDRDRYPMSLCNACLSIITNDKAGTPLYMFSISRRALVQKPWRTGTIYLLPRTTFTLEPAFPFGDVTIQTAQLASLEPVEPLARITVTPADFPFLEQIRPHDDERLQEYATAMQTGAPWPD